MHELGILRHVMETVVKAARQNNIDRIRHITLEVGEESGCVPHYLTKLFPIAVQQYPEFGTPELKLLMVPGRNLQIKELGY